MNRRTNKVYVKWDYKAIEDWDTNYFFLYYQDRKLFWDNKVSLCFIKDMWFEQVLSDDTTND